MKKIIISWVAALMMVLPFITTAQAGTYTSDFNRYLADNESKDQIGAIITMADQVDLEALKTELYARKADRQEWHEEVVRALQDKATESQANVLAKLDELKKQGAVSSYKNLWLGNLVIVTATRDALDELVQRVDVDQIAPNYNIESVEPIKEAHNESAITGVESGLTAIHAEECWAMGYTGEGRLVSHLDTGVDGGHVAFASRWRGLDSRYADNQEWAWYDPVTNTTFPFDSGYHGTHTMGTICGLGEDTGDTIGVAFGAEWISAGVIDRVSIDQSVADALTALQWVADPDEDPSTVWDVPDVCSNSWGVNSSMGYYACDATLWDAIDGAEAAGVVVVFAAGNEGSSSETLRTPADRATTELTTFAVGAVDGNDDSYPIADFSSRGPSYCTEDGSAAIKPEISAPGVNIRSAYPGDTYTTLSGTSMAAPHIAGVVALIRQANPNLTSDQVKQIILNTAADLGNEGDDNLYGMGIIDAYAAVQLALTYADTWGMLAGTITDQATGEPIHGATVSVVDRDYSTISRGNGKYFLPIPADTLFDIKIDYSPTYIPLYDQQSAAANETTAVDYALEPKVTTTFTVSFGNGADILYRNFYMKGSWDNDGYFDASRSGDIITLADDGDSPDETAGDGVFTAQILLVRDLENIYSWSVYTENYGANSLDDAFLADGENFVIDDFDPVTMALAPNPSGSDNNFVFSVEGDNELSFDLQPGINDTPGLWGNSVMLAANTAYTFTFHVMHGDEAVYGESGIGGSEIVFTPTSDAAYDFLFNDNDDSYLIQLSSTSGAPAYPSATSGEDGHIPVTWMLPGTTVQSIELAYDDGTANNNFLLSDPVTKIGVMFIPESYPVEIDSVMIHVITEGDADWPYPDETHDPISISIYTDNGYGSPDSDPVFSAEATAELGEWIRLDVDEISVTSGYFWVVTNAVSGEGTDALGVDAQTDYSANQWFYDGITWSTWAIGGGDNIIRTKVFSDNASTWLGYDDAKPAQEITAPVKTGNFSGKDIANFSMIEKEKMSGNSATVSRMAYYPHIISDPPVINETEIVAGYNLYRSTTSGPFDQGLKVNDNMITATAYNDWGTDVNGPIVNGTTYYYQVSALYNIGGEYVEVGPSEEVTATAANQPPTAPDNLVGDISDHTVTLTWDANTDYDVAAYNIYRHDTGADDFALVATVNHPVTTYSEELTADGIYRYKIKVVDTGGMESASYSNNTDITVGLIAPGTITASTNLEFQVKLKWLSPGNTSLINNTEALNVAAIYADVDCDKEAMAYLIESGAVSNCTCINTRTSTPTLSDIEDYDMIFLWSNYAFENADSLGNVLADYVDLGKPVIAFNFALYSSTAIGGRFMDDYSPLGTSSSMLANSNLGEYNASSPIMAGVTILSETYVFDNTEQNNADVVAYWDNGSPAVAASEDYPIVCINAYFGSSHSEDDMYLLIYNTVNYLANGSGVDPDGYKLYKSTSESGDFELLASLGGDVRTYYDSPVLNGVPYYYKVTAIWDGAESEPSNTIEGYGQNYVPEAPTGLTCSLNERTVSLAWAFTDLMGDLDHYNIYRRIPGETGWGLVGSSTAESYTEEIADEDEVFYYEVTAVDNGEPQLESDISNIISVGVGNLPPVSLIVTSNQDGVVPLYWSEPGSLPCTTIVYDDGQCSAGVCFMNNYNLIAKQFTGIAPFQVCSVYVHILTEGDPDWPQPDSQHDPSLITVWADDGTGQPGAVLAETTATCELGEWLTIYFPSPVICTTDNFWVSWTNYQSTTYDYIGYDASGDYSEYEWYLVSSDVDTWINSPLASGDFMIRASVSIDGITELLTENNPVSSAVTSETSISDSSDVQIYDTEEMLGYYIYRNTSPDVPLDDTYRITSAYLADLQYDDGDVTNGTTYYYVVAAAYNDDGEIILSEASNEVSATPANAGQFAIDQASIAVNAEPGDSAISVPLVLTNGGGLPVTFSVAVSTEENEVETANPEVNYLMSSEFSVVSSTVEKSGGSEEITNPPVITDNGGPDDFGYYWVDSDDENGPEYNWIDITGIGERIYVYDEENSGPHTMEFDFSFYGTDFSAFRVCANGWMSFTSNSTSFNNVSIPSNAEPYNLIAPFWDDLYVESAYYYTSTDSTIISWINAWSFGDGSTLTFQVILTSDDNIILQYRNTDSDCLSGTIGIQNADGSDGLCIAYDSEYLHDEMAIAIGSKKWLSADVRTGTIPAGGSLTVNAILDPTDLEIGNYYGTLTFNAYDINHDIDPMEVPVTFVVDTIDVSIDDYDVSLPAVFSLDQNYPNPFNAHTEIKYALPVDSDVQLEIYNVLGQKVTTLVDEEQTAGYHSLIWDGTNESGQAVSSGMYLYKLVTNEDTFVKKMVMLK